MKAYTAVAKALRAGKLKYPEDSACSECGSTRNVVKHHDDYSKPLEVIYLCKICHVKRHREVLKWGVPKHSGKPRVPKGTKYLPIGEGPPPTIGELRSIKADAVLAGLSLKEISKASGVSYCTASQIMNGRLVHPRYLAKIQTAIKEASAK